MYTEFYQLNLDKQITERIRILDSSIFSERKISEFLRNISNKKRTLGDNKEDSSDEKHTRHHEDNDDIVSELVSPGSRRRIEILNDKNINFSNEEVETEENLLFDEWVLSTGKNVSRVLETLRSKVPKSKAFLYPTFFGILDLSGENTEVKDLFTDDEWAEMKSDFNETVMFKDINEEDAIEKKSGDLMTDIEKCIIEENPKVNSIRRLIQAYSYNLERLQSSKSEAMSKEARSKVWHLLLRIQPRIQQIGLWLDKNVILELHVMDLKLLLGYVPEGSEKHANPSSGMITSI
ncbi:9941_t:CDS:2 [Ambispora leptoticha]|uniref:9941_t:CDS:1 n=1 Tax=Ambispora leptoticha TaxID=144679 RepID=A0A9N9FWT9_9GLOM|nr:9941_t:CDS:2 [Ambispora leptoticha]